MPISNTNSVSREQYLKGITHPRKRQLATMILDRASVEEMNAEGFARLNIMEASRDIRSKVEGERDLKVGIPRGTGMDSTSAEDIARTSAADDAEKKTSPEASQVERSSPASVTGQTAGDTQGAEVTSQDNSNVNMNDNEDKRDENPGDDPGSTEGQGDTTAPSGDHVPGVTADQSNVETVGGNPVGTLTGEEDAETLQRKADEEAAA